MAVTSFRTSSMTTGLKRARVWDQSSSPGNFESIATNVVGAGGTLNVIFSNIPQTYTHLQLRVTARAGRASNQYGYLYLKFNGAFPNAMHYLFGDGSSIASSYATSINSGSGYQIHAPGSTAPANSFGVGIVDILDYTNTNKTKTIRVLSGTDTNTGGIVGITSILYNSTSAITSLTIGSVDDANIAQYSHFALYGVL